MDKKDVNDQRQSSTDQEIGAMAGWAIGAVAVLAIGGTFLPEIVVALLVGISLTFANRFHRLPLISGVSLVLFFIVLYFFKVKPLWQFIAWFKGMLPAPVYQYLTRILNNGADFKIIWQSYVLAVLLGLVFAVVVGLIMRKLQQNYFVKTKEEKSRTFEQSQTFKKIHKKRLTITDKQQDNWRKMKKPKADVYLGANLHGEPVYLPIKRLFTHMLIQGTTGSGKTVAMLSYVEACVRANMPVAYVEAKGDPEIEQNLQIIARRYNKKLKVFSDRSDLTYNPLKNGNPSAVEERLMSVFDWSEQYYKNTSDNMLIKVIRFMDEYNLDRDLPTLNEYLNFDRIWKTVNADYSEVKDTGEGKPKDTFKNDDADAFDGGTGTKEKENKNVAKTMIYTERAKKFKKLFFDDEDFSSEDFEEFKKTSSNELKNIHGLKTQVDLLVNSDLGMKLRESENSLDMTEFLNSDDILLFSFDSNSYGNLIPRLGRLVISDIATAVTKMYAQTDFKGALGIFDEFGSYANDKIIDVLAKARSAHFGAIIGVQSMEDLNANDPDIDKRIRDNVNTFMLGRSNDPDSAEHVSNLIGTYEDLDKTIMIEDKGSIFARIDTKGKRGTVRDVHKFVIPPDDIKRLENYTFVVVDKGNQDEFTTKVYSRNTMNGL